MTFPAKIDNCSASLKFFKQVSSLKNNSPAKRFTYKITLPNDINSKPINKPNKENITK